MSKIGAALIKKFIKKAGEKLDGQWVLMGGSLMPFLGASARVTYDIDLAGFGKKERAQNLEILEIAEDLGVSVEAVNQAAGFFLQKIDSWKSDLVVIHQGRKSTIYRPSATLYLILKIQRLSESDLEDCLAMLKIAKKVSEDIDRNRLEKVIRNRKKTADKFVEQRLEKLLERLT